MSRDPTVLVNLTLTTPVGPQTRSLSSVQAIDRVERLRYHRRQDGYGSGVGSAGPAFVTDESGTLVSDEATVVVTDE